MPETTRRNLAKGIAWSIPAVSIAAAAPASAVSPSPTPPGLQGYVYWHRDCTPSRLTIAPYESRPSELYPTGSDGFYVLNATQAQVSNACMSFTLPTSLGVLSWQAFSDNGAWSVPATIASDSSTITYQTCYSGTWVNGTNADTPYTSVTSYPHFYASSSRACAASVTTNIVRTVVVNGKTQTLTRTVSF